MPFYFKNFKNFIYIEKHLLLCKAGFMFFACLLKMFVNALPQLDHKIK